MLGRRGYQSTVRRGARLALVVSAVVAVGLLAAGCGGGQHDPEPVRPSTATSPPKPTAGADGQIDPAHPPKGWSLVAWPRVADIPVFAETSPPAGGASAGAARPSDVPPTGRSAGQPTRTLANPNAQGSPLALLVERYQRDWLRVSLPVRPNGTAGWVRTNDVQLVATQFALAVDRARHELTLFRDGRAERSYPVGIGTGTTPTPTGRFYLAQLLRPANPDGPWGPYAFGLSGFSDVVTSFNGGDGIIGLHGTNHPEYVGTDVSMGCIRLRNQDILELADLVPVGSPITIT